MKTKPAKLFLVLHPVLAPISDEEAVAAIPARLKDIPYQFLRMDVTQLRNEDLETADFDHLSRVESQVFADKFKPELERSQNKHVLYLGKSPIPIAANLGALFGSWQSVDSLYNHHSTKEWYFDNPESAKISCSVSEVGKSKAQGSVVIRLSTTVRISPEDTAQVIPHPLAEIDVQTSMLDRDSCDNRVTKEITEKLRKVLDEVNANYPNRTGIHLFAAAPMGLMFEVGAGLTPSMHYPISFYQYFQKANPKYRESVVLSNASNSTKQLSDNEKILVLASLEKWQEELKKLKTLEAYIKRLSEQNPTACWMDILFSGSNYNQRLDHNFCNQPLLSKSGLSQTEISADLHVVREEFALNSQTKKWAFGDLLLHEFVTMSNGHEKNLRQSMRLFLLHEAVHDGKHALREIIAANIGQFPKVVEEVDYQSDVWGISHELFRIQLEEPEVSPRQAIVDMITNILKTFMAFDKAGGLSDGIQVRRVNRYLIWLMQLARMERLDTKATFHDVIEILLSKPVVELAGFDMITRNNRILFKYDATKLTDIEVGLYVQGKVKRFKGAAAQEVMAGLFAFDFNRMLGGMRGILATIE